MGFNFDPKKASLSDVRHFAVCGKFNAKCPTNAAKCNATHQLCNVCVCVCVCVEKQFRVIAIEAVSTTI